MSEKENKNSEEEVKLKEKKEEKASKDKEVKIKTSELDQLKADAEEYKDKYLRLYAEFENARKRMDREKLEFVKYANEELIKEFLGTLDNLELAVKAAKEKHQDYDAFLKGIELVMAGTYELLKKNGVDLIKSVGKPFDPNAHEVLMQEESEEIDENVVIEEFQKGYKLGEKVIRTAKVKIAKNK